MIGKLSTSLRNFFIPNLQNQLRPVSLRFKTLLIVVFISAFLELVLYFYVNVAFRQNPFLSANVFEGLQSKVVEMLPFVITEQSNSRRQAVASQPLSLNPILSQAAKMKADDMAKRGYFSHLDPQGKEPWTWLEQVKYQYARAGENLAINFYDARDVVEAWMNSPEHRENLLNPNFTETGVGVARGQYLGKETLFVVQFFTSPNYSGPTKNLAQGPIITPVNVAIPEVTRKVTVRSTPALSPTTSPVMEEATSSSSTPANESPYPSLPVVVANIMPTESSAGSLLNLAGVGWQSALVSPRYFVRNIMIVLLVYVLLVLLIPMMVIYAHHRSNSLYVRIREIWMLFDNAILSAIATIVVIGIILIMNYWILGSDIDLMAQSVV